MANSHVQAFPAITDSEFGKACLQLVQISQPHLKDSIWKSVAFTDGELRIEQSHRAAARQSQPSVVFIDDDQEEIEDLDQESVVRANVEPLDATSFFSILLSPVYQVPVLWFKPFSDRPAQVEQLDQIYASMVDPQLRSTMQQIGVMGAISIAHHPKIDLPMFFIHPCETQDALRAVSSDEITPIEYLTLWFGIIGASVGLAVPVTIAAELGNKRSS